MGLGLRGTQNELRLIYKLGALGNRIISSPEVPCEIKRLEKNITKTKLRKKSNNKKRKKKTLLRNTNEEMNILTNKKKELERPTSKVLTKEEKKTFINESNSESLRLSFRLREHTKRNENGEHINYKLHHLLHDPFTFVNAYAKISKNKGTLTEGHEDEGVMKLFGLQTATRIAEKIKNNKYQFKPIKRIWIPKPGKNKKRPIDIPTQSDRIVQEALRGILEAIYEPEFKNWGEETKHLSNNYGFRPGKSTWSALDIIKKKSQRCTVAIEGDIVSAYNNVDYNILLSILKKRIKDKKFLHLIKQLLECGVMNKQIYEHSIVGTPQGGIVSPLLFNIYLFGLDQFVYHKIILPIINADKDKRGDDANKTYRKIRRQTDQSYLRYQEIKPPHQLQPEKRNSTPYSNVARLERKAVYVRYADDWVLTLTCNQKEAEDAKTKITQYLLTERKMQLDDEKTKITRVSDGYHFLGFEIRKAKSGIKQTFTTQKQSNGKTVRMLNRTTSRQLTIEPHSDRILNRLKMNDFCNDKYEPRAKPGWLIYEEYDIVEKYSQIFRGIYNYYLPCQRLTRLNRISYILQYSCARTLARKRDTTLQKTFNKYGKNLIIQKAIENTKGENVTRTVKFYTLTDLKRIQPTTSPVDRDNDPFRIRQYWENKNENIQRMLLMRRDKGDSIAPFEQCSKS